MEFCIVADQNWSCTDQYWSGTSITFRVLEYTLQCSIDQYWSSVLQRKIHREVLDQYRVVLERYFKVQCRSEKGYRVTDEYSISYFQIVFYKQKIIEVVFFVQNSSGKILWSLNWYNFEMQLFSLYDFFFKFCIYKL